MKSVILSSLILISSLFLYVACGEKPQDDTSAPSTSTPPIIPPVLPATCNDILVPGDCGTKALANNVAATTCVWNSDTGKCVEKPAGEEEAMDEEEGAQEEEEEEVAPPAEEKPATCADVKPKNPTACKNAELSDPTKKCEWKDGDCVEKIAPPEAKPATCGELSKDTCVGAVTKNNETCAFNNTTGTCVAIKDSCKNTTKKNCGVIVPTSGQKCEWKDGSCVDVNKVAEVIYDNCEDVTDTTLCAAAKTKNNTTCAVHATNNKCTTRANNCFATAKDNCGHVTPVDGNTCGYDETKGECVLKEALQGPVAPTKCTDIKDLTKCEGVKATNGEECTVNTKPIPNICVAKPKNCAAIVSDISKTCGSVTTLDNVACVYYKNSSKKDVCVTKPTSCGAIKEKAFCENKGMGCKWSPKPKKGQQQCSGDIK